ncbi:MAG: hypothetical protein NTY01_02790 [Verrucomicrobia bacterium]|nr:hypothetical protein [Verrucomicrobiota bacterium]
MKAALILGALLAISGPEAVGSQSEESLLRKAATWLLRQARGDAATQSATWSQFAEHPFTTDTLYSGTAGVVASLLTLSEITGENRYSDEARRGARHLLRTAVETPDGLTWDVAWDDREEKVHHSRRCGLYNGSTGIAWVLLKTGELCGDKAALDAGRRGFDWVCRQIRPVAGGPDGKFWDDGALDIISGSAGIIVALLDAHRMTGEQRYCDAAIAGADGLLAAARRSADGWSWTSSLWSKTLHSGFSHGTAGIGCALARVYTATGDPHYLQAAQEAARWLDRNEVRLTDGACAAWRRTEGAEPVWEGWCHGPAGTCRLHLLLHSLTGDERHLETAEAGARWIMTRCDPDKDRSGAHFYAPSLCCGAAGIGDFMLDLHRYTGKREYLDFARRIAGFLDRVADKPTSEEVCWSLSGRPEGKSGKVFHGTCLMVGQGGYITFLSRLMQEQQRLVREIVTPPDWTTVGLPPGRRLLVVEYGPGAERFHVATRRLASFRGVEWERLADAAKPDALRDLAWRQAADALAIVVAPETLDINLNHRVLNAVCRIDDDIFPDASYGYLTGADPASAMTMLERMAAVERDGLPARGVHYGTATIDKLLVYPAQKGEGGIEWTGVYIPTNAKCPAPRDTLAKALAASAGAGVVTFGGNGDPMRVWLFSDQRNLKPEFHWPYDSARIVREFAHREMPALGATELGSWDLAGRVVWFSTCHSGVPVHAMVAGDIVATFGKVPDHKIRFYDLLPQESFCLNLLARGPSAYLAPIGPNHGYLATVETYRAVGEKLPLGEAIRRNQIDVALTYRAQGGIPLVQQKEGEVEAIPPVLGGIMREGTLNRILFGDPTFEPFRGTGPKRNSLEVRTEKRPGGIVVTVAVADPKSPEHWDPYRGTPSRDKVPDMGERIVGCFELERDATGIQDISVKADLPPGVELTNAEWAIETRRARPPVVWFSLNAPKHPDFAKRNLWKEGARFVFDVKPATHPAAARKHGAMKR